MKRQIEQLKEFHETYGVPVVAEPALPAFERCELRQNILEEEVRELRTAVSQGDITETADAIIDCIYILIGTAHEFGLAARLEQCFDEVHRSNMSKLGEEGKPILREDGKVIKGPNYSKPNLLPIISQPPQPITIEQEAEEKEFSGEIISISGFTQSNRNRISVDILGHENYFANHVRTGNKVKVVVLTT